MRELMQVKRGEGLRELARSYGVSYDMLYRYATSDPPRLRTVLIGGRMVVPLSEIQRIEREGLAPRKPRGRLAKKIDPSTTASNGMTGSAEAVDSVAAQV